MKKYILSIACAWVVLSLVIGILIVAIPYQNNSKEQKTKKVAVLSKSNSSKVSPKKKYNTTSDGVVNSSVTVLAPQYKTTPAKAKISEIGSGKVSAEIEVK